MIDKMEEVVELQKGTKWEKEQLCADSLVVRIGAFQALDPGSNPG